MKASPMSASAAQGAKTPASSSSTRVRDELLLRKGTHMKPLLIAFHGQDSMDYVASLVNGGPGGGLLG